MDFPEAVTVLRLAFWDVHVIEGMVARVLSAHARDAYPSVAHAQAILDFGRQVPKGGRVLIHCGAGINRSTAAALILAAQAKPGDEWGAFQLIKVLRPQAQPNPLLVRYADKLLGTEGRWRHACGVEMALSPPIRRYRWRERCGERRQQPKSSISRGEGCERNKSE